MKISKNTKYWIGVILLIINILYMTYMILNMRYMLASQECRLTYNKGFNQKVIIGCECCKELAKLQRELYVLSNNDNDLDYLKNKSLYTIINP